jgi:hypothetical protein
VARESRRKREARRFGVVERVADYFLTGQFAKAEGYVSLPGEEAHNRRLRGHVESAIFAGTIEATNVFEYSLSMQDAGKTLLFDKMIVNATPPLPLSFVEFSIPRDIAPQVLGLGWAVQRHDRGAEPDIVYEALATLPAPAVYEKCRWVVVGTLALAVKVSVADPTVGTICPAAQAIVFLDDRGDALSLTPGWEASGQDDWITHWAHVGFFDCMLAFCFMNCGNVTLGVSEPDAARNRERQKAGLRPFVRYHTIDIEPMRRVLREEGDVDNVGLARALHRVRGHFCLLTRNNKGEPLETPTRYFREAHVRGSAKQGVVVSDYRVKP